MNCDRIARWYKYLEYGAFGHALERCRFMFFQETSPARRVLMLGEGDGRFLRAFLRLNGDASVDYVDASAEMLQLARQRATDNARRVRFHHADVLNWTPPREDYDLVVTHFFLDCFDQPNVEKLVTRIASHTADAVWIASDFHQPESGFAAVRAAGWLRMLYLFFRFTTGLKTRSLADYRPALRANGFCLNHAAEAQSGLLVSELWRRINSTSNRQSAL